MKSGFYNFNMKAADKSVRNEKLRKQKDCTSLNIQRTKVLHRDKKLEAILNYRIRPNYFEIRYIYVQFKNLPLSKDIVAALFRNTSLTWHTVLLQSIFFNIAESQDYSISVINYIHKCIY